MMDVKQSIADRLRTARKLAGLSQGQTAKKLNFHRPTISEIEAGRRSVKVDELSLFANLFGVQISWLTGEVVDNQEVSPDILAAARDLSSMKASDLETLMNTIKMIKSKGNKIE